MRLRTLVAALFLAAQLGAIVYTRFTPRRFFCWSPNDTVNELHLSVELNGHRLSPQQVLARYGMKTDTATVEYPIEHVMDFVRQYETTYGRNDHARVRLSWRHNGRPEQQWQWPQQ
jgi:hypothetical protein